MPSSRDYQHEYLIYKAYQANKRIRILSRVLEGRREFALYVTGGKWNFGTLFQRSLRSCQRTLEREMHANHPRAKRYIVLDNTGETRYAEREEG